MRKKQYLFFLLLALSSHSFAQKDAKMQADKAYDHLSYLKAAELYQQLGEGALDAVAKGKLADSYRLNGDTESAEYWYAQSVKETEDTQDILHYAQMLQSNGKCELALDWYDRYRQLMGDEHSLPRAAITDCSKVMFSSKQQVVINNVDELNSKHLDYSPIAYKDGLIFTSTRGKGDKNIQDQWTKDNFSDLFFAKKMGKQPFSMAKVLEGDINGFFHDGVATFNQSGDQMYFSRNNENGKNSRQIVELKIYSAELKNKRWVNVKEVAFNNPEFSTCHPALSMDGNTLYFASNRPGGFGGMDIYKVTRMGNKWSALENLGASINTAGNEIFPFVDKNETLSFASDGFPGVGGLDIYQSSIVDGEWTRAENIGEPINSPKDDFAYTIFNSEKEGYFSSNRNGGKGGDDIYHWSTTVSDETNQNQNVIAVIEEETGKRIPDAVVTIVEGLHNNSATLPERKQVSDAGGDATEHRIQPISFLTDISGKVQPDVRTGKTYTILVEKAGYTLVKKVVTSSDLQRTPELIISLSKRKGLSLKGTVMQEDYNHMIPNANVELFNYCTGEYERTVSDEKGNFEFFLECNCDYELVGKKDRFRADKKNYSTQNMDCQTAKPINSILYLKVNGLSTRPNPRPTPTPTVNVKPKSAPTVTKTVDDPSLETYSAGQTISLDNVYYDYNKATIRGDASYELDKIVQLLNDYPSLEIELLSHTDARGRSSYNERLSQKRADSAVDYIVSKGIASSRLSAKGYGESQIKNHCTDGVKCEDDEHQINRRTEVKITKLDGNIQIQYRK